MIALITSIMGGLSSISAIASLIDKLFGIWSDIRKKQELAKIDQSQTDMHAAKTPEEKAAAEKEAADAIHHL